MDLLNFSVFGGSLVLHAGLTIVVGKKGSGKTGFALGLIAKELERGKRIVITNMEIYKDKLESWFRSSGKEVNVADRLVVLGAKDRRFQRWWRIRGESPEDELGAFGLDSRWDSCEGILYVVDEGQHHYPARGWTTRQKRGEGNEPPVGEECNDYLCQERKTGDDTVVTTPSSSLLDKDFRTLSTECVVLENWYRKRIRGVRPPGRFDVSIWENCPPQPGEEPIGRDSYQLDSTGLMACYNTAAGAGFIGSRADLDKPPPRGVHLYTLLAGLLVLGVVGWFGVHWGMKGFTKLWSKKMDKDLVSSVQVVSHGRGVTNSVVDKKELVSSAVVSRVFTNAPAGVRAVVKGTAGWAVVWEDGTTDLASSVVAQKRGGLLIDGLPARFVSHRQGTNENVNRLTFPPRHLDRVVQ